MRRDVNYVNGMHDLKTALQWSTNDDDHGDDEMDDVDVDRCTPDEDKMLISTTVVTMMTMVTMVATVATLPTTNFKRDGVDDDVEDVIDEYVDDAMATTPTVMTR